MPHEVIVQIYKSNKSILVVRRLQQTFSLLYRNFKNCRKRSPDSSQAIKLELQLRRSLNSYNFTRLKTQSSTKSVSKYTETSFILGEAVIALREKLRRPLADTDYGSKQIYFALTRNTTKSQYKVQVSLVSGLSCTKKDYASLYRSTTTVANQIF